MRANNLEAAFKAFQTAIKADPSSAQAHNNLGVVYERRGMLNDAMMSYKKALQLNPQHAEAKANLLRFGKLGEKAAPISKPSTKPGAKPTKKVGGS